MYQNVLPFYIMYIMYRISCIIYHISCIRTSFLSKEGWKYSTVCTERGFFIRSSIEGQLGCSRILAVVSNSAVNVHRWLLESLPSGTFRGIHKWNCCILWHICVVFLRAHLPVFHSSCTVYIPTNSAQEFQFLHTSAGFLFVCLVVAILVGVSSYHTVCTEGPDCMKCSETAVFTFWCSVLFLLLFSLKLTFSIKFVLKQIMGNFKLTTFPA